MKMGSRRRFGKLALFAGLIVIAVGAAGARPERRPAAGPDGPRIEVVPTVLDLGQVPKGKPAEARFEVHNRGNAVLRIDRVKPG